MSRVLSKKDHQRLVLLLQALAADLITKERAAEAADLLLRKAGI